MYHCQFLSRGQKPRTHRDVIIQYHTVKRFVFDSRSRRRPSECFLSVVLLALVEVGGLARGSASVLIARLETKKNAHRFYTTISHNQWFDFHSRSRRLPNEFSPAVVLVVIVEVGTLWGVLGKQAGMLAPPKRCKMHWWESIRNTFFWKEFLGHSHPGK